MKSYNSNDVLTESEYKFMNHKRYNEELVYSTSNGRIPLKSDILSRRSLKKSDMDRFSSRYS